MKSTLVILIFLMSIGSSSVWSQAQQPFIISVQGGLFFPAQAQYKDVYQVSSDLVYGFGIGLPISSTLIATGDMSWFKSEAILGSVTDSTTKLQEKFIHVGLLNKQPINGAIFLRLSGGLNYVTIKQAISGPQSPENGKESDKKLGYYAGIGVENLFEGGRVAMFADAVYDYSRWHDTDFNGDFGGVRAVLGFNFILF